MKKYERLLRRLREELHLAIPEGAYVRRTRAGRHQKATGAWSWYVVDGEGKELAIGSPYTVTELVRARALSAYSPNSWGTEICPEK